MKLRLHLFTLILFGFGFGSLWAQYGFGTNNPNASAAMEIVSPDKGVLIPKISLSNANTFGLYLETSATPTTDHHGMLVFNTNTATKTTAGVSNGLYGPGVYYWHQPDTNPGSWVQVGGQELNGEFTQTAQATSSIVTLTLSGDPIPVVLDVSALEEMQHGTGSPTAGKHTFNPSPTNGSLYFDTDSSTIWGYVMDNESAVDPKPMVWKRIEGLNIYNSDGTLLAERTVTFNHKNLNFVTGTGDFTVETNSGSATLQVNGADNRVYVGTTSFTGTASYTQSLNNNNAAGTTAPQSNLDLVVEGDIKAGRFLLDKNNNTGKIGQSLVRTDEGMEWQYANLLKVETITSDDSPKLDSGLVLLQPGNTNMTLTLPEIGGGDDQYPIGYTLKIRRNQGYSTTNGDGGTISIAPTGTNATIGGAAQRTLNMGWQSITLVAAAENLWAVVD